MELSVELFSQKDYTANDDGDDMDTKFTLTLYDVLDHLIPGSALLLSFAYFNHINESSLGSNPLIYLLVFGYIAGILLHLIGLLLFKAFYIEDYRSGTFAYHVVKTCDWIVDRAPLLRMKSLSLPVKQELAKAVKKKLNLNVKEKRLLLFSVADAFTASLPLAERDVLSAKEGLFRSLTTLVIIETGYLALVVYPAHRLLIVIVGLILTEACRYAREYYRTIRNQQIYTVSLIKLLQ